MQRIYILERVRTLIPLDFKKQRLESLPSFLGTSQVTNRSFSPFNIHTLLQTHETFVSISLFYREVNNCSVVRLEMRDGIYLCTHVCV